MRQPQRRLNRGQESTVVSLPAPVGGWNARDSLADMPATDAVELTNWFPGTTECIQRQGYSNWSTGLPAQVESLLAYSGGSTSKLFAVSNNACYDCTSGGAVGAAVWSGKTNSRWQYCNITISGTSYIYCANGVDKPMLYNGATWTAIDAVSVPAITAVTSTTLNNPIVFKNRIYFTQTNTLVVWFLPVLSIGGAAQSIDMSSVAQLGGYIVQHATWTIDGGYGVDDYYAAVTNNGELIVYQGTDPTDSTKWALKGVWRLGSPVGTRCFFKFAGDLLYISQDGLQPMSGALQSSRVNPRVTLTNKIQWATSTAISQYGSNFGWQVISFPRENQLWLNVPVAAGYQQQYVMNTITQNWCNFTGWAANCWELWGDSPYFGGNGVVCKAWTTNADNGANIQTKGLQAFNSFRTPGRIKSFTMTRPVFRASGIPSVLSSLNIDFSTDDSTAALSFATTTFGLWDAAKWDVDLWGGDLGILQAWQGANGVGYYAAPQVKTSSSNIDVRWVSTDIVMQVGQIL